MIGAVALLLAVALLVDDVAQGDRRRRRDGRL